VTVEIRHDTAEHLPEFGRTLLDRHAEVRHRDFALTGPFYDVERFNERLNAYDWH
jgi:hypothetical protein